MLSYVCEWAFAEAKLQLEGQEVISMGEYNTDDFYETFENELENDEISPEEEGFMKGFTEELEEG